MWELATERECTSKQLKFFSTVRSKDEPRFSIEFPGSNIIILLSTPEQIDAILNPDVQYKTKTWIHK